MKKTYINPETEVTRIAPIVMAAASDTINITVKEGTPEDVYGKEDDDLGGPNLWD